MYKIKCLECKGDAELIKGEILYPDTLDAHGKFFYICRKCDTRVGTHQHNLKPLGTLANKQLRIARNIAHRHFDKLWLHSRHLTRSEAYIWLSFSLGVPPKFTHIAQFNLNQCQQTAELSKQKLEELDNESISVSRTKGKQEKTDFFENQECDGYFQVN